MIDLTKLKGLIKKRIGKQIDFANLIEEDKTLVNKVLNGKCNMTLDFADRTIRALNMSAKEIQEVFFTTIINEKENEKDENLRTKTRIYRRKH